MKLSEKDEVAAHLVPWARAILLMVEEARAGATIPKTKIAEGTITTPRGETNPDNPNPQNVLPEAET